MKKTNKWFNLSEKCGLEWRGWLRGCCGFKLDAIYFDHYNTNMFKQSSRPALFVLAAIALCIPVKGDISIAKGPTSPTEHLTVIAQFETTQPRGDADYL